MPDAAAHRAAPDVTCEPLAQCSGERAIPAIQQASRAWAQATCRPRGQQHAEQFGKPGAGLRRKPPRLATRYAQSIREVSGLEPAVQVQLDELPLGWLQARERGPDEVLELRIADMGVVPIAGRLDQVSARSRKGTGTRAALALVTGDGEQPRSQPVRILQARDLGPGDNEGVVHRVSRVGRVDKQRMTVTVKARGVPVVGRGKASQVAPGDRGRDPVIGRSQAIRARNGTVQNGTTFARVPARDSVTPEFGRRFTHLGTRQG